MSFEAVLTELKEIARADSERRHGDRVSQFAHLTLVTDADIQKWSVSTELARSALYDRIAIYLARGFHRSELSFEFCDQVVNEIHGIIVRTNENRPTLYWEVFLAFDAGEFYRNSDRSRDPVDTYTRPLIAKVVEKHSTDYPDV